MAGLDAAKAGILRSMADLRQHLSGVHAVVRARFDKVNRSVENNLTYGQANEVAMRELLLDFLPSHYGVGSGFVLGTEGGTSRQVDVIVFDRSRLNPAMTRDAQLFFADQVHVAVELKTSFSRERLQEALENVKSVKERRVVDRPWVHVVPGESDISWIQRDPRPPLASVLFLGKPRHEGPIDLDAVAELIETEMAKVPIELQPEMVCSVPHGLTVRHPDIGRKDSATQQFLLSTLLGSDGVPLNLNCPTDARILVDLSGSQLKEGAHDGRQVGATRGRSSALVVTGDGIADQPAVHPLGVTAGRVVALDVERAFLNFVFALETLIAANPLSPGWTVADYLGREFGHAMVLRPLNAQDESEGNAPG